ncbi:energy transducer TonB [Erythrobacter alti]|uniref:energy transducer TonB n=1 Tax=Erythrobacter alti TaxID=1896145 RepID=UPI0030F42EC9
MERVAHLSPEERVGIGVAVVAHIALAAALAWHATREPAPFTPVERIDVSLATEVSLESTAPDPSAEPAASFAPVITEVPVPPEELVTAPPVEPRPAPTTRPTAAPTPQPTTRATSRPTPTPTSTQRAGGSRLGENFLEGNSASDGNSGSPAATFGRTEQAALSSAITRELRPHWSAPSGVDVDQLVSVVSWSLNRDGTLRGQPRCVSQRGINDSNRPQAQLHCERAIRAVTLAAPFTTLPDQFYSRWDDLEWEFDRRL